MCEVQKFELLKKIRQKALTGQKIIEKALNATAEENVKIQRAILTRENSIKFNQFLGQVAKTTKFNEMVKLFENEEIIPLELIIVSQFWNEMQELVYSLKELEVRKELEVQREYEVQREFEMDR